MRQFLWDWNPKRLRRLLAQAKNATDANAYGWANTHRELLELRKECAHLQAEIRRLEQIATQ